MSVYNRVSCSVQSHCSTPVTVTLSQFPFNCFDVWWRTFLRPLVGNREWTLIALSLSLRHTAHFWNLLSIFVVPEGWFLMFLMSQVIFPLTTVRLQDLLSTFQDVMMYAHAPQRNETLSSSRSGRWTHCASRWISVLVWPSIKSNYTQDNCWPGSHKNVRGCSWNFVDFGDLGEFSLSQRIQMVKNTNIWWVLTAAIRFSW